jgi:hypothetical protein
MFSFGNLLQLLSGNISESASDAVLDAAGFNSILHAFETEVTLARFSCQAVERHGAIGASRQTEPAAVTRISLDNDDAILSLHDRTDRANL